MENTLSKSSLDKTGLSLSQAQSISNLCFQRTLDITNQISVINNSEKTLKIGSEVYKETIGNKIPTNIVELILEKGLLHATQAFLMENIKIKDQLLKSLKNKNFSFDLEYPTQPDYKHINMLPQVVESWGWNQLTNKEYNEFLEAESYAAHIGQFIHKDSKLDTLRKELSTIKTLEWINIEDGKKTPLKIEVHHTQEELLNVHNKLAALHRKHEQKVNYFKAKVKNLVTEENARISKFNADEQAKINSVNENLRLEFNTLVAVYEGKKLEAVQMFEKTRQDEIKDVVGLRIKVDERFQPVIDKYLAQLDNDDKGKVE